MPFYKNKKDWNIFFVIFLISVATVSLNLWNKIDNEYILYLVLTTINAFMAYQIYVNNRIENFVSNFSKESLVGETLDTRNFYSRLMASVNNASTSIDLMSMQHISPGVSGVTEVDQYFYTISNIINNNKKIRIRRLVSIRSLDKYKWVLKIIDDHKNARNFNIRFVDIAAIYKSDGIQSIPHPLNVQIIDKKEAFFINPQKGFFEVSGNNDNIYIKSENVSKVFSDYFDRYWDMSTPLVENGKTFKENLEKINKKIGN